MATAMTFNSLLQDLRDYLERGFVTDTTVYDKLPTLINNAEREIAQDLKILGFLDPLTSNFVTGTSTYAKPDRWRGTVSMNYGATKLQLYPRSYEYCRQFWPNPVLQGAPKFYADYDYSHWLIVPTPNSNYDWETNVYRMPQLLDNAVQTNWLTDFASTTLLYRSLLECTPFLKDDNRIPTWEKMYEKSKGALNIQDLERIVDRNVVRSKD